MAERMTFNEALEKIAEASLQHKQDLRYKGDLFEKLISLYFKTTKQLEDDTIIEDVLFWEDFRKKYKLEKGEDLGGDTGIDLIAKISGGDLIAIQCKFHEGKIAEKDTSQFFSAVSKFDEKLPIKKAYFVHTSAETSNVEKDFKLRSEKKNIGFKVFNKETVEKDDSIADWASFFNNNSLSRASIKDEREHQKEAKNSVVNGFKSADRGKLIMPCGTGKTYTSLKIVEEYFINKEPSFNGANTILFLAPSIALIDQTCRAWKTDFDNNNFKAQFLIICSDNEAGSERKELIDSNYIPLYSLVEKPTTNSSAICEKLNKKLEPNGKKLLRIAFSTYQSLDKVEEAMAKMEGFSFDLVICDEAHRTAGAFRNLKEEEVGNFQLIHNNARIPAKKRLYMTATPKVYSEDTTHKTLKKEDNKENIDSNVLLFDMNDAETFGEIFYELTFGEAVKHGLLVDYKVILFHISDAEVTKVLSIFKDNADYKGIVKNISRKKNYASDDHEIEDFVSKALALWKALAKTDGSEDKSNCHGILKQCIAFNSTISYSEKFSKLLQLFNKNKHLIDEDNLLPSIEASHIAGAMGANKRNEEIKKLKHSKEDSYILSNVRCLSEGVDVPSLDAISFIASKQNYIDIIQSVGRVMRTSPNKNMGYIILPFIVSENDSDEEINYKLSTDKKYKNIWQVLNALRTHDERLNIGINQARILSQALKDSKNRKEENENFVRVLEPDSSEEGKKNNKNTIINFLNIDANPEFAKRVVNLFVPIMSKKCGDRNYIESWALSVGEIVKEYINIFHKLYREKNVKRLFDTLLSNLQRQLYSELSLENIFEMLSSHIVISPVFNALFKNYKWESSNVVSKALNKFLETVLVALKNGGDEVAKCSNTLEDYLLKTYESESKENERKVTQLKDLRQNIIKTRVEGLNSLETKQAVIKELYEKFYQNAFKKQGDKLGIVYTPNEVVEFIIKLADNIFAKYFNEHIYDKGIKVLDPFTGTGTFITQLLSYTAKHARENLEYKYQNDIMAHEIMLLSYYIASVNIEEVYHNLSAGSEYKPFNKLVLADTFNMVEREAKSEEDNGNIELFLKENDENIKAEVQEPIRLIIGNPPYSARQKNANEDNANIRNEAIEERIRNTYISKKSQNQTNIYDNFMKAFRWASDKILDNREGGVVAFITNNSFLESDSASGFRKAILKEFSHIYIYNFKGNVRNGRNGDKKQGQSIFEGVQVGAAITILVRERDYKEGSNANIYYAEVDNFLTQKEKIKIISDLIEINNILEVIEWKKLEADKNYDILTKMEHEEEWNSFVPIGKSDGNKGHNVNIFTLYSRGVGTSKDIWLYNFSNEKLYTYSNRFIDIYKNQLEKGILEYDIRNFKWTRELKRRFKKGEIIDYEEDRMYKKINYRLFCRKNLYFSYPLITERSKNNIIFPKSESKNLVIILTGKSSPMFFSCFISDCVCDLNILPAGTQCFPLYYYDEKSTGNNNISQFLGGGGKTKTEENMPFQTLLLKYFLKGFVMLAKRIFSFMSMAFFIMLIIERSLRITSKKIFLAFH